MTVVIMTVTAMETATGNVTGTVTATETENVSVIETGTLAARTTGESDTMKMMHTTTLAPRGGIESRCSCDVRLLKLLVGI